MSDKKIDVHAHFLPPSYRETLVRQGLSHPDGMPGIPPWSVESHLDYMNANGISKSILSISSPGTSFGTDETVDKICCREVNEYGASLKRQHPDRFGFFASLPLPHIQASIDEFRYLKQSSNPDGFIILSNSLGVYLGDPLLRPVLAELNDCNAVVFVHPTSPCTAGCARLPPTERLEASSPLSAHYSMPLFEFLFDSARSILDLILSGTALRFPNIRWIVSHCGGVLPLLIDRTFILTDLNMPFTSSRDNLPVSEQDIREVLNRQFWFDVAGKAFPNVVESLLKFVGQDRLMIGSDVPWTPFAGGSLALKKVEGGLASCVDKEYLDAVYYKTAESLLQQKQ